MPEEDENFHPLLQAIIDAKKEGREKLEPEEIEEALEDDPKTKEYLFNELTENRTERYEEETEELFKLMSRRGDQRIGQFLINAIRFYYSDNINATEYSQEDEEKLRQVESVVEIKDDQRKAQIERLIWALEEPDILEAVKAYVGASKK